MCGNGAILNGQLRDEFGMGIQGGSYVQGDCGAVDNIYSQHHYVSSYPEAAALALNAGTDIDCGSTFPTYLNVS